MDTVYILGVLHIPTRHKSKGKVCYYRMWVCLLAMYNGRIGWGFLFGGILLNFCCCVFVCACFELSICLLGSSSNKNRCWLKHLGSRRTPKVRIDLDFQFSSMGRKLFAVDLQENEWGIESSRRTFHYEEFIFLGQVWGGHQLCHQLCRRDYLQLQRPAQVGKPSDRIQKGQGPYVFFENTSKWREEAFRNVGQGRVYKSTTNLWRTSLARTFGAAYRNGQTEHSNKTTSREFCHQWESGGFRREGVEEAWP